MHQRGYKRWFSKSKKFRDSLFQIRFDVFDFFSGDRQSHVVSMLLVELIEKKNKSQKIINDKYDKYLRQPIERYNLTDVG